MKKALKRRMLAVLFAAFILTALQIPAFAAEDAQAGGDGDRAKAKRTVLLYDCGSDLETEAGLASYNLRQVLNANFSKNDDVRFIVMTGGADKWHLEKEKLAFPEDVYVPKDAVSLGDRDYHPLDPDDPTTYAADPKDQISNTYNQIWEAKGRDAVDENGDPDPNAGKLVLLDGDGVMGDGENAKRSIIDINGYVKYDSGDLDIDLSKVGNYEWMNDPEVLKAFIDYGVENYPADKYDLILWDHGAGPDGGFCSDLHETSHGLDTMQLHRIIDALAHNKVVDRDGNGKQDSKFDLINFDACLMNSVEINLLLSDLTDYYIASPELEPGYGQEYKGWLDLVGSNPDIGTYELGKQIVDDFIAFYDKESGDGSSQDGTLALVDMNKLMSKKVKAGESDKARGFLDGMTDLNRHMQDEITRRGLYYDEFRSFKGSMNYGNRQYYDLGNLLSQLSYVYDEADRGSIQDGKIDDRNAYTDTAQVLTKILNDPEVMYARGTKGIQTGEQFYRNADGQIVSGKLGTSGTFICFEPLDPPRQFGSHQLFMELVIKAMDPADPRTQLLKGLDQTMLMYGLAYYTGMAVTDMVSQGTSKEAVDYAAVREYWDTHTDNWGKGLWEGTIQSYMKALDGGEAGAKSWLEGIIRQQRDEVVLKDKIQTRPFSTKAGFGCTVTLNEIRKQAIDSVNMDLIAELPSVKAFMEDPAHAQYTAELEDLSTDLVIGTIQGSEVLDFDPATQDYERAIEWLLEPRSQWKLDPPPDKWYALRDASGKIYATCPSMEENEIDIPTGYYTTELRQSYDGTYEEEEVCHLVYLIFEKNKKGAWNFTKIFIQQGNGSWRCIPVSEYKGNMELVPMIEVTDSWSEYYLPASRNTFRLSAKTKGKINLKYMDIKKIPDIADTDGDGRSLHSAVTINNIYGHKMDITDLVNEPTEKMANTLSIKGKTAKVKYSKLKKKTQTLKMSKVIKVVKKGQGRISYAKLSGNKKITINERTGKVRVKKGLKKGTHRVKVRVTAAGNAVYTDLSRTVTFKVKVR